MRWVFGGAGVLVGVYGGYLLLGLGLDNLVGALVWLAGGVLVHDGIVGVALVAAGAGVSAMLSPRVRAPVAAGLVILGTVTITAVPMLGRFGAKADNVTLLDRNYVAGWLVFAALVVVATSLAVLRRVRQPTPREEG